MEQLGGIHPAYGAANNGSGFVQNIAPPPPPPGGSSGGSFLPPPPPQPGGAASQARVGGVTYTWNAADSNGVQTGTDSKGSTYAYNPTDQTITNENNGDTYRVKTLTAQNGKPIANFSYGKSTPQGKIESISSFGRGYTFNRTPGEGDQYGTMTKNRTGQTFDVVKHTNPVTGATHLASLGPGHYNRYGQYGIDFTRFNGNDPWATRIE